MSHSNKNRLGRGLALACLLALALVAAWLTAPDSPHAGERAAANTPGLQQSPIDLPARPPAETPAHQINIRYGDTTEHLIHRDHTIELQYDAGSAVEFDGIEYDLEQLHFHTPSEHLVGHKRFPVELHLVHHSPNGRALVIGVLFEIGSPNSLVEQILSDAPNDIGRIDKEAHLNVAKIFPKEQHFYSYIGSLTTPPYDEGIQWLVLSEHPSISPEQVVRLLVLEGGNARGVQPLNGREIEGW